MRSFTYAIQIDRSPEAVFAFMMDFTKASRWRNLVRRVDLVTPPPLAAGSVMRITVDVLGTVKTFDSELWAYDPPRRFGMRNTASNVTGVFEYQLTPRDAGTVVQFTCDIRPHGWMWLVLPLIIKTNRARYRDQLGNLKREAEAS